MSSHFLGYYTEYNMKNKVYETVRHLINKNIESSLTDQALIGKNKPIKILVQHSSGDESAITHSSHQKTFAGGKLV